MMVITKIYEYCEKVKWEEEKIKQLAQELNVSYKDIIDACKIYEIKKLKKEQPPQDKNKRKKETEITKESKYISSIINGNRKHLWKTKEEKYIVLKYVYEYCVKEKFSYQKIKELANKLGKDIEMIKKYFYMYIDEYLDQEEKTKTLEEISKIKQKYKNMRLKKVNMILYNLTGKKTYYLWETDEEKELVLKHIFYYCEDHKYLDKEMRKLASILSFGVTSTRVVEYAKIYATEYLNFTTEQFETRQKKLAKEALREYYKNKPNKVSPIYEKLLKVNEIEDIIKIIEESEVDIKSLRQRVSGYITVHRDGNKEEEEKLKENLKKYVDYINNFEKEEVKDQEKEKNLKKELSDIINEIKKYKNEKTKISVEEFCKINNITIDLFNRLSIIINEYESKHQQLLEEKTKEILLLLKTGIEENGYNRQFDLIDYYNNYSGIPLKDISKTAKTIFEDREYRIIKRFVDQNIIGTQANEKDIKQIIEEKVEINQRKDKNGIPISGTGEIISNEKKLNIIKYLKDSNMPINRKTYMIAFKRYLNGYIDINVKSKTRKR